MTDFGFAETEAGRVAYLVMEYLDGCTLGEILDEEKTLSLAWTVDILEQVCLAVTEAHRQGIIHRDLKPDNIWLAPNERGGYTVKVLDFGIAKLETQSEEFNVGSVKADPADKITKVFPSISDQAATEIFSGNNSLPVKTGYETFIESVEENAIPRLPIPLTSLMNSANDTPLSQLKTLAGFKSG